MVISTSMRLPSASLPPALIFTRPAQTLTAHLLVRTLQPDPAWTRIDVQLLLDLPNGDHLTLPVQLVSTPSTVGTQAWLLVCPACHTHRRKLYLCGRCLSCQACAGLRYVTQAVRAPRRRADCFGTQRRAREARPGRRSRRWAWLVLQERQEALRLLNQALRTAGH